MAAMVVRARRLPASASGSIWLRRAEITANSAPTKNALPSSRTERDEQPDADAHRVAPPRSPGARSPCGRRPIAGWKRSRSTRRPSIRSTRRRPPSTGTSSPTAGTRPRRGHHEPADGLVVGVVGHLEPDPLAELVRPQQPGHDPAAVPQLAPGLPGPVVLVGDLADHLLDDVLEGHDARRAAVLVDDDGQLQALPAQLRRAAGRGACVSGTTSGVDHQRAGRHVVRGGRRAPTTARLTWTTPTTSSRSSSIDREAGVAGLRAELDDPAALSVALDRRAAHRAGSSRRPPSRRRSPASA